MPADSNAILAAVLEKNGWSMAEEDGQRFLVIDGTKVRYYDYPPAEYEIAVRKMIMKNTMAEMNVLFDPNVLSGTAITDDEMRRKIEALYRKREEYQGREELDAEFNSVSRTLAALQFQFGGNRLLKYLGSLEKGPEDVEARKEGFKMIGLASNVGEFGDLKVLGKHPTTGMLQGLAINMRDIADVDVPLEDLITDWYRKVAEVKDQIRDTAARSKEQRQPLQDFAEACCRLVDARRNEPEYDLALVDVNARMERLNLAGAATRQAAEDMFWMARVREPLIPGLFPLSRTQTARST